MDAFTIFFLLAATVVVLAYFVHNLPPSGLTSMFRVMAWSIGTASVGVLVYAFLPESEPVDDWDDFEAQVSKVEEKREAEVAALRAELSGADARGPETVQLLSNSDGHYLTTARVNGAPVDFVVDTGATFVTLRLEDARRIGLDTGNLRYDGRANTANGVVRYASVTLDSLSIKGMTIRRVKAVVIKSDPGISLLGMSYLKRLDSFSFTDAGLILNK